VVLAGGEGRGGEVQVVATGMLILVGSQLLSYLVT
jgi:hypothetical protein